MIGTKSLMIACLRYASLIDMLKSMPDNFCIENISKDIRICAVTSPEYQNCFEMIDKTLIDSFF